MDMKKVLFALVLAGGLFAMSGCAKECNCVAQVNDEVVYESTIDLGEGKKCSDYNSRISVLGVSAESKCTPVLF